MTVLIPTKYEKINENTLVIGASVIALLKKKRYSIEELYQTLEKQNKINLERFYNTLSFLWITEVITTDQFYVSLKKQNYVS